MREKILSGADLIESIVELETGRPEAQNGRKKQTTRFSLGLLERSVHPDVALRAFAWLAQRQRRLLPTRSFL